MYCSKCGKDYGKAKKICSDCHLALTPGSAPNIKKSNKGILIVGTIVALVVIAVFVVVGITGHVPSELSGMWYNSIGFGTMEFKGGGKVEFVMPETDAMLGEFEYDRQTGQGKFSMEVGKEMDSQFTFDGTTIQIDDGNIVYTREYVAPFNLNDLTDVVPE